MSVCLKRLIYWLVLACVSIGAGLSADIISGTAAFPLAVRLAGIPGLVFAHLLLKRSGRVLRTLGQTKEWGCTTRLVTVDTYQCLRHPHHLGIGIFMTSLGLLIGHPWSFGFITFIQWVWVIAFLFLVEEKELKQKFGQEYEAYKRAVPMLIPKPPCVWKFLFRPFHPGAETEPASAKNSQPSSPH